ncbi:hypothetical protein D3C71_2112680 [compost metagenome]
MPGADVALGKLVNQILRFKRHLAGYIEGQGIRTVLVQDAPQTACRQPDRVLHLD